MLKHSNVLTNWKYSTLYEQNISIWPKFEKGTTNALAPIIWTPMHLLQLYGQLHGVELHKTTSLIMEFR